MKIFEAAHIREWDRYTMEHEPIESIDLMERAARVYTGWMEEQIDRTRPVHVICGPGNNGGDGLVIARLLALKFYPVTIHLCHIGSSFSQDNQINQERLPEGMDLELRHINEGDDLPDWKGEEILLDALFGSGLSRPVEGYWAELIERMNSSPCAVYAVDVPSGLYSDQLPEGTVVRATDTLSFEIPKRSFFHNESEPFTGSWDFRSIGLHQGFPESTETNYHYVTRSDILPLITKRSTFSHKGSYGHALLLCGSTGMFGAAQLAGRSCLCAGAGKVTLHAPSSALVPLQSAVPEMMFSSDPDPNEISELPELSSFDVIGIGCGIGTGTTTARVLMHLLEEWSGPLVLDADALNILPQKDEWKELLPIQSILTPHPGECDRMLGQSVDSFERLEKVRSFAKTWDQFVVLKGAYSRIVCPDGTVYYNASGNPGLATAGSGDVLAGLITGWLAQGYGAEESCLIAVHQHGATADRLAGKITEESITAGDLIREIPYIFKRQNKT